MISECLVDSSNLDDFDIHPISRLFADDTTSVTKWMLPTGASGFCTRVEEFGPELVLLECIVPSTS
jgi:hypothetical protein